MPKPPKVVPIQEKKYQLIAKDTEAKRIILGIGRERIAIDWFSRISKLRCARTPAGPKINRQTTLFVPED